MKAAASPATQHGQPATQQPRGVYPYRRETVISVCGFSFMASSLTTKFGERDGILEIPEMPSMPGARCNRQCSYMSRQCSSLSPGAVTCKLVSAPRPRLEDRGFHISIYKSFWCSNDVSGGQSKIVLRRLQQEWFLSLDIDIYREGRCKLSNAAAGQPVTQQPRGVIDTFAPDDDCRLWFLVNM